MASLFKRKGRNGGYTWYVTYFLDGKPRMKSTGTSDKKLAMEVLRKTEEDLIRIEHGLEPTGRLKSILLSEFASRFLADCEERNLAAKTLETYKYSLRALLAFHGDRPISTVNGGRVQSFRQYLINRVGPVSVNDRLRSCKVAFEWAVSGSSIRYLHANPFKQKGLFLKVDKENLPRSLTPTEKEQFLQAIDDQKHRELFVFYLLTGARRNEALDMEWKDVDWERHQIIFRRTKSRKDRVLPISLELGQLLLKLDRSRSRPFPYVPATVNYWFKKYAQKAGLDPELHLHCLRHTAATELMRAGVHPVKIQKLLGHHSLKMTEQYISTDVGDVRDAAELLTCTG